jgi:putative PIN family toxin of toxin-antitoxin system
MRIAIDTNCLVAAVTRTDGSSAAIVRAWLDGEVEVVASEATMREAELVLGGGWLARVASRERVDELLAALRSLTIWVDAPQTIADLRLKDEGDQRMVEAAVSGGAQYVVTTDREFLRARGYGGVEFVTPGEMARILEGRP